MIYWKTCGIARYVNKLQCVLPFNIHVPFLRKKEIFPIRISKTAQRLFVHPKKCSSILVFATVVNVEDTSTTYCRLSYFTGLTQTL